MDFKKVKIIVGLALESALVHRRDTHTLLTLYADPDLGRIHELHDQLMASPIHNDREVAIWLEPALKLSALKSDPKGLVREMREMEVVLYGLINRAGEAQRDVNNWMDYIANAAYRLENGSWIDAKILLSKALQSSRSKSVEQLKVDPVLKRKVEVLQKATTSYFMEAKDYPLVLKFSEERLDLILKVQGIMLELMQFHYEMKGHNKYPKTTKLPIYKLSLAVRFLIDVCRELEDARREICVASRYLETKLNEVSIDVADEESHKLISSYHERMQEIVNSL